MTVVLLASVSLFGLVVAGRPIASDSDLGELAPTSSTFQTPAVQAAFQLLPGRDHLDAARFQSQDPKQRIEYLPDAENIASFESVPGEQPSFQTLANETPVGQVPSNDQRDDSQAHHVANGPLVSESVKEAQTDETPTTSLVLLTFSCVAAFLALACIALSLYIIKSLRSQVLASRRAWELLPRFWRYSGSPVFQEGTSTRAKERLTGGDRLLLQTEVGQQGPPTAEEGLLNLHTQDRPLYLDATSDMESEWGDTDEKYQDALDMTPLPPTLDLPLDEHASHQSHFGNPPLQSYPLDQSTDDRSTPLMHELCPSPRPAWSVRAIDSPALGLSSRQGAAVDSTPQPLVHPRRRAYRMAVPEFDITLAMQLRPGLGIGADSAWMVRFLMTIFGWFAVALTGNAR